MAAAGATAPAGMGFDLNTRTIYAQIGQDTRTSGGVTNLRIANTGFLARLWVTIRGSTGSTAIATANAFGFSSVINRVRVQTSGSVDLFNMTGPSYYHLLAPILDQPLNALPAGNGRSAILVNTAMNLDMVIPIELNMIDQVGYFSMQNNKQFANFILNWETNSVAFGQTTTAFDATGVGSLVLYQQWMTVPEDSQGRPIMPMQGTLHTLRDWTTAYSAAGEQRQAIPIASSYAQLAYGAGFAAAGADSWSRFKIQANHHDTIYDVTPEFMTLQHGFQRGLVRALGVIPVDLYGGTGRGVYGSARDTINSQPLTDLDALITITAGLTLYTVAREIIPIPRRA